VAGDDRCVGVGVEVLDHGAGKLVGAGGGVVELAEQCEGLAAEGVLDQW
jgi:hypothetical protein